MKYTKIGRTDIAELPTASHEYYLQMRVVNDSGSDDVLMICLKDSAGAYGWYTVGITL